MNPIILSISERIRDHLTKQNAQALSAGANCRYRGHGGTMCAVGCLISDAHYLDSFEGHNINDRDVFDAVIASLDEEGISIGQDPESRDLLWGVLDDWQLYHDSLYEARPLNYVNWLTTGDPEASPEAVHERIISARRQATEE